MMLARKRQRFVRLFTPATGAVVGVIACLLIAVSPAPASASWGIHKGFGGEFQVPVGVAVDEAGSGHFEAGSIYVGSLFSGLSGYNLADELVSPSSFFGGSAEMSGVAVNPVNHNVYAVNASEHKLETFDPSTGAQVASFEIPGTGNIFGFWTGVQIASDAHGNVYVPDAPENKVEVFDETGGEPEGGVAKEIGVGTLSEPEGVAIGAAGNVWVADTGAGKIEEFSPSGTLMKEIASPQAQTVALDGSGDVFALIGGTEPYVVEYNPSGTAVLAEFGKGVLDPEEGFVGLPDGIAVDQAREIVYVADFDGNVVDRFVSWGLTTEPPSNVGEGQATLHGTVEVEPGSSVSTCEFEYGLTAAYGSSVPCAPGGPYTANMAVSAPLSGLNAGVDYHYRISATNAGGFTQVGEDRTFGPPAIDSESAVAIVTTATLRAHLTVLEAGESSCKEAQYVAEAQYAVSGFTHAHSLPCIPPIGSTPGEYDVESEQVKGLQADTVYHYRFITESHAGTQIGPDMEFATFGIVPGSFSFAASGEAEEPFTQAGGHPYEVTDTFRLNTSTGTDANPKNVVTELPPGLIGNPDATPKCLPYNVAHADCSGATQVGIMALYTGVVSFVPIYNLVPPKGLAAQFGARFNGFVTVHIDSRVRTGGDYGVTAEVIDGSAGEGLVAAEVTLWGVPAAESHDNAQCAFPGGTTFCGRACPAPGAVNELGPCSERGPLTPFLSNPTACTGEREARMTVEPWQQDEPPVLVHASAKMPAITGCGRLDFKPSMAITPTSTASDSPSGLDVELKVPQNEDPTGLAEADLKNARVTLPAGVTVNPSSANGLLGCPLLTGKGSHAGESGIDLENGEQANCPNASKVGKVTIETPLLEHPLTGGVYVAQQNANPFKSLLALYIAAENEERGVVVKLAGKVSLDAVTGQLTTTFDENPQLPFETLKLSFFGGERAPLATPRTCGSYQPSALLEPFSHQGAPGEVGTPDAEPYIHTFEITSGPSGAACGRPSFAPSFLAGTTNNQAGASSPFTLTFSRKDGEQALSAVSTEMPPGLLGMLSKIQLCGEPQAGEGRCPSASQIGHVISSAGVGSEPLTLPEAGKPQDPVFLTGPYKGAPFGLAIVVPAEAGPFSLGTVIVRAAIRVNPNTSQISVVSDAMPTSLQGIPLDVRSVEVAVDREGFMFNPTDCEPLAIGGAISSAEGATANVSSRFEAANCAALPFKPGIVASTQAATSKANGASLHVKVTKRLGEANIRRVDLALPRALPSRLATLQKACTEAQFDANPAGCPAGSVIGTAKALTPVLQVPLTGPAYLVSHGGAAFPDVEYVLQADERGGKVEIVLDGKTQIKNGITYSHFDTVPDAPISSFETDLPEGPHSVLTTERPGRTNLCALNLRMPTTMVGQNGAQTTQSTKVAVSGCKAITIGKRKLTGASVTLALNLAKSGTVTVTGAGLKRYRKTLGVGAHQIKVPLSKAGLALRARHGKLDLRVAVRSGKNVSSATTTLRL